MPKSTKEATKFGLKLFRGRKLRCRNLLNFISHKTSFYFKLPYNCLDICLYVCKNIFSTDWFQQQSEFTNEFEDMSIDEMNKFLSKFYLSVRNSDGNYYKKHP